MHSEHRTQPKLGSWLRAALLTLAITLIASLPVYVLAYLVTGCRTTGGPRELQSYHHEWQCHLFDPAVKVEAYLRGQPIDNGWLTDL